MADYRDPEHAAMARVAQLEEENRALKAQVAAATETELAERRALNSQRQRLVLMMVGALTAFILTVLILLQKD